MRIKSFKRLIPLLSMLIIMILGACSTSPSTGSSEDQPDGTFTVDVTFREFYQLLGGEETLGYPISASFEYDGVLFQYTEKALMKYDALAQVSQQFSLAPLGSELGVEDDPMVVPEQEGVRVVDGYIIYDEFVDMYDYFQGARFAGKPLTQARVNSEKNRIEQYFENVGFYRSLSDEPGKVGLLALGAWKCDTACRQPRDAYASVSTTQVFPEPFLGSLDRIGTNFAGQPLSEPYTADDGSIEQVYENVVVYANPANVRSIAFRPITSAVGYPPTEPAARIDDDRMVFFSLEGDMGHNIPSIFDEYITLHGGFELAGNPTTELFAEGKIWRQCFTNYCLDYDPQAAESLRVRMAPLGALYLKHNPPIQSAYATLDLSKQDTSLSVWEEKSLISSTEEQQITVQVSESGSQTPIPDIEAELTITLPDNSQAVYNFQPTDADGLSTLTVPAIQAKNGSLIPYRVCLKATVDPPLCVIDSYVIWGNP